MKCLNLHGKDYLNECFTYVSGRLFWKTRPEKHFISRKACRIFNAKFPNREITYIDNDGYIKVNMLGIPYRVHRIIYTMHFGDITEGFDIDHINGIRNDNRIENLRIARRCENLHNSKGHFDSKTGVKGTFVTKTGKILARVMCKGVAKNKLFLNMSDAILWLDDTRKEMHGSFSNNG